MKWDKERNGPQTGKEQELAQATPADEAPDAVSDNPDRTANGEDPEGLLGPVQIEYLDGLDVIVLRGKREDVERVNKIIREIEDSECRDRTVDRSCRFASR